MKCIEKLCMRCGHISNTITDGLCITCEQITTDIEKEIYIDLLEHSETKKELSDVK